MTYDHKFVEATIREAVEDYEGDEMECSEHAGLDEADIMHAYLEQCQEIASLKQGASK